MSDIWETFIGCFGCVYFVLKKAVGIAAFLGVSIGAILLVLIAIATLYYCVTGKYLFLIEDWQ